MLWTMPRLLFLSEGKKRKKERKKIRLIYCVNERKRIKDGTKNIWKPPNLRKNVTFSSRTTKIVEIL